MNVGFYLTAFFLTKNSMKKLLPLLILICLTSCDPVVVYDEIVQTIAALIFGCLKVILWPFLIVMDSVLLVSKDSLTIAESIDIGGSLSQFENCLSYPFPGDALLTRIAGNPDLKLNIAIDKNADFI